MAKLLVSGQISVGITFRHATGRPITLVVDAISVGGTGYFLPVEGPVGSDRLPDFQRVDGSLSWFRQFGKGHDATFYMSVGNLLNQANVLEYEYSADYAERTERTTNYRRFLYCGAVLNLVR